MMQIYAPSNSRNPETWDSVTSGSLFGIAVKAGNIECARTRRRDALRHRHLLHQCRVANLFRDEPIGVVRTDRNNGEERFTDRGK